MIYDHFANVVFGVWLGWRKSMSDGYGHGHFHSRFVLYTWMPNGIYVN